MRPKRYLLLGGALLADLSSAIDAELGTIWYRHGAILTADDHGVCAEVARSARTHDLPCQIVGTSLRPTNGAKGNYTRLVVSSTLPRDQRRKLRDQFLVQLADYVIVLGNTPLYDYARAVGKPYVYAV